MQYENFISRAPLRLGIAGGGSDIESYFRLRQGEVINLTIAKYATASITFDDHDLKEPTCVAYTHDKIISENIYVDKFRSKLPLHWACIKFLQEEFKLDLPHFAKIETHVDAPVGSGLGSSSALVVAILSSLLRLMQIEVTRMRLAEMAVIVERRILQFAGGWQDQYAAALGGLNYFKFLENGKVIVDRIDLSERRRFLLESCIIMHYMGTNRLSSEIISDQIKNLQEKPDKSFSVFDDMKGLCGPMLNSILSGDLEAMAEIMRRGWDYKQQTASKISNKEIHKVLESASSVGSLAAKVSGAGGGGYCVFLVKPQMKGLLLDHLRQRHGNAEAISVVNQGVTTNVF